LIQDTYRDRFERPDARVSLQEVLTTIDSYDGTRTAKGKETGRPVLRKNWLSILKLFIGR
jgi:hypothetical protein